MIIRLSQKLNAKIKGGTLKCLPSDENPIADWSATLFLAARLQYILVINTQSLYGTVLLGGGITDAKIFVERMAQGIRDHMEMRGYPGVFDRSLAPHLGSVQFAQSLNRSITGSMTDMIKRFKFLLEIDRQPLIEIVDALNDTPMSGIRQAGSTHEYPREAFKAIVDAL